MTMNREYIAVIVDSTPVIIFKDKIVAIEKDINNKARVLCINKEYYCTQNDFDEVFKHCI